MKPDTVSERPFSCASLGKNGAIIDIEQKLIKSTRARDARVIFCLLVNFFIADGSKGFDLEIKEFFFHTALKYSNNFQEFFKNFLLKTNFNIKILVKNL